MITKNSLKEFWLMTFSTLIMAVGIYFFKFPNNFTFGGVTGLAVLIGNVFSLSAGDYTFIINMALLIIGLIFLGKGFAAKTAYTSILLSVTISGFERLVPLKQPLTDEPLLELVFAIALPAFGSAILFNIGASSGGTDVIAMLLKKYTSINIGNALLVTDILITLCSFFIFDVKTGLFSVLGLTIKSLLVDSVIESINLCKYFNVVCKEPEPICDFIVNELNRSATICEAEGAFSHGHKYIVFTVLNRQEAIKLRMFIKSTDPTAFILITNTSEIIGKGFHNV
ncbi:YitT family protein [Velocimicrobium porci]|uniref:YitT family protein n=1 Tax=Velocimicrobium porci TaxID=2606634 RepID=A0A6L5Y0S7_9FIRM|nr:YitT family protein [Velocimicrobium porci]MSS64437.1 YitT family protein [Velocimicrobium porci]